jgi:hypothetical protein
VVGTAVPGPVRKGLAPARGTTGNDRQHRSAGAPGTVTTAPEPTAVVRERVVRLGTIVAVGGERATGGTEEHEGRGRRERMGRPIAVRA